MIYIEADVISICSILHKCTGCAGSTRCCCSSYEVTISKAELIKIVGLVPEAAKFCAHLKIHKGFENVFEEISRDLFCIDTTDDGLCVFAYSQGNKILCSLHSAAMSLGIPTLEAKPKVCFLWPLAISRGKNKILSLDEDAFQFKCNLRKFNHPLFLCPSLGWIVENYFGQELRNELENAARDKKQWTRIGLHSHAI